MVGVCVGVGVVVDVGVLVGVLVCVGVGVVVGVVVDVGVVVGVGVGSRQGYRVIQVAQSFINVVYIGVSKLGVVYDINT